ncbi:hypothetical protein SADUNF_Sadunf09G0106500 [Salix dunnii]|uniref:Dirigent protein n=1 Tax=Salix dunnii TaxID=1413687 RepID=A0A835N0A9_9ROSI|nr:hypothetical protein SADUNF_Sadunf09G0106500 [Salix dunnii]
MERMAAFVYALIVCAAIAPAYGEYYTESRHVPRKEKVTRLHFFLHDILSGKNPSAVKVAGSNRTEGDKSPTPFGSVYAIDDPLKEGPEPDSNTIGNAQGLYLSSSQDYSKFTIVMGVDFGFTEGKFKGSSFSVFSRNPVTEADREVAVVGGRGKFRMARGFAKVKTSYFNATTGDAILEYKMERRALSYIILSKTLLPIFLVQGQRKKKMEKASLALLVIFMVGVMQSANAESWARRLEAEKETVTNLQFYFHDIVSGKNPTAIKVAQPSVGNRSPTLFGSIMMADDPLTEGPDPNSKPVGRAQGIYGSAGRNELALIMAMNFDFTDGIYNGSCISLLGKNPAMNPVREMPIVGGTGLFRFARGYAIAQTFWLDVTTGDAIVGYNVTVAH